MLELQNKNAGIAKLVHREHKEIEDAIEKAKEKFWKRIDRVPFEEKCLQFRVHHYGLSSAMPRSVSVRRGT